MKCQCVCVIFIAYRYVLTQHIRGLLTLYCLMNECMHELTQLYYAEAYLHNIR